MPELNSEKEFLNLFDKRADAVFRYCYFRLNDRAEAEDAVQEIFAKTWKYIYDGNKIDKMEMFVWKVASNLVKDIWRKKKAIPFSFFEKNDESEMPAFDISDENVDISSETEYKRLLRSFAKLTESDRQVLQFRFVEDLPVKNIAVLLGEKENTIAVRINRALERLRKINI